MKTMKKQYPLAVGILLEQPVLRFQFRSPYACTNGKTYKGEQSAICHQDKVMFDGELYDELSFTAENGTFLLHDVIIGVNFHWQRREEQVFEGNLKVIVEKGRLTAVNLIGVEDYLTSVITSEMSATSSFELLKAHAVISRSWVLCPIVRGDANTETVKGEQTEDRHIVWYERDDHQHFDVCADDHCQRYQGITRLSAAKENVRKAIEATWGQVLKDNNGAVCDARFYKSCGGATELFENAWADTHYHYLEAVRDDNDTSLPDLTVESNAEKWIRTAPQAYCNTHDARILSQVLNNYDQETTDFYRWQVRYTQSELSELVRQRSGIDFGTIEALEPVRRGPSGRLVELRIVGTKRTIVVGKELEIRKWLSKSHLYSSAFVVDREKDDFILTGAGWGHGVGLCQIGAAVMADKGFDYKQILAHYFPGSKLETIEIQ